MKVEISPAEIVKETTNDMRALSALIARSRDAARGERESIAIDYQDTGLRARPRKPIASAAGCTCDADIMIRVQRSRAVSPVRSL